MQCVRPTVWWDCLKFFRACNNSQRINNCTSELFSTWGQLFAMWLQQQRNRSHIAYSLWISCPWFSCLTIAGWRAITLNVGNTSSFSDIIQKAWLLISCLDCQINVYHVKVVNSVVHGTWGRIEDKIVCVKISEKITCFCFNMTWKSISLIWIMSQR